MIKTEASSDPTDSPLRGKYASVSRKDAGKMNRTGLPNLMIKRSQFG
jgi:hypothetical protein